MAVKRPAKLRVILDSDDTRKLILPDGIPETIEQMLNEVRKVCELNGNFRLQYQDRDFGDALVNLTHHSQWEEEDRLQPPHDIGVVIDGVKVLNDLPSVAHACAMLFGLIYALNLSYPSDLKYTFDALQKIIMEIEPKKMTRRVCTLNLKL